MDNIQAKSILIIDDDPYLLRLLEHTFVRAGARVYTAVNGREGLRQLDEHRPDLVILDVMMPEMDGWEVCRRMRRFSDVPIIFLTALAAEGDIVRGLDVGAFDYVTKPFSPQILLARARAALRQAGLPAEPEKPPTYRDDYLTIDLPTRGVLVRGKPVKLSATEYRLLAYLLENAGRVVTFQQILDNVWGRGYRESANYVHVYMSYLRQKLEADPRDPQYLLTEHGVGYRFQKLRLAETA